MMVNAIQSTDNPPITTPAIALGQIVNQRYRIEQQLGCGGFGTTYLVLDSLDQTQKVLKVLTRNDPKHIELFEREADVLAHLAHPGIPSVQPDAFFRCAHPQTAHVIHCLVMEKIAGLNLYTYLAKRQRPINQKLAVQWLMELMTILQVIHQQGILHRDIKPANIMLRSNGRLALIDFGAVHSSTQPVQNSQGTVILTELYTPVEQITGKPVPQSDYFAMGRTFVQLLTGQPLPSLYDKQTGQLQWRSQVSCLSAALADLLDDLMNPFFDQRPADAVDILQRLTQIQHSFETSDAVPSVIDLARAACHRQEYVPTDFINELSIAPSSAQSLEPALHDFRGALPTVVSNASSASVIQPSVGIQDSSNLRPEFLDRQPDSLSDAFLQRCKAHLAEFIGPIANMICDRTLAAHPYVYEGQLIEYLAQHIPDPSLRKLFISKFASR